MACESSGLGREHPGHTQQIATLPTHLMGRIPGRCRNARGRCGGCRDRGGSQEERARGFLMGPWPRLGLFLRIFQSSVPRGTRCGRREGTTLEFSRGCWVVPQLGTLPGPSFWQPSLERCVKGQGLSTGPSQIKAPPWPPLPPLAQHLASSHDQKHRL